MLIGSIFKKYKEKGNRISVIKELIISLNIDNKQKQLYIESLEVLDEEALDRFYKKLTGVIDIIEEGDINNNFNKNQEIIIDSQKQEQINKIQELNSFNILLDNI